MALTQIRGNTQIKAGTILDAQISASAAIASSKLADGANFLKKDGSVAFTADLNAGGFKITNLADPTSDQEAATKKYVDDAVAGVTVTGAILADGTVPMAANLDLDGNKIVNLANPTAVQDAMTLDYSDSNYLRLDGANSMQADLAVNNNYLTGVNDPVNPQDGASKNYVDNGDASLIRHDGTTPLSGDWNAGTAFRITNLADPIDAQDAATKVYVDGIAAGLQHKQAVRVATTANITLSAPQTIDGVSAIAGNRVLVKNQSTAADNGIYVVAAGAWSRAADLDEPAELTAGIFTFVEEGTSQADTGWVLVSDNPIVLGTDPQVWTQFSSAGVITAGAGLLQTGNAFDVVSANAAIAVGANNITLTVADATLTISGSGLKLPNGTAGQVTVANGSGLPVSQTLSGDVASVSGTGVVALATSVVKTSNVITRETPSGTVNGSNVTFTLANTPVSGTECVFVNGILQDAGGNDYSISTATITFVTAPESGDKIRVNYLK